MHMYHRHDDDNPIPPASRSGESSSQADSAGSIPVIRSGGETPSESRVGRFQSNGGSAHSPPSAGREDKLPPVAVASSGRNPPGWTTGSGVASDSGLLWRNDVLQA